VLHPAVAAGAAQHAGLDQDRVAAGGLGQLGLGQRVHVVRAAQPHRGVRLDGHVEQGLVQLGLDHLGRPPTGPDRLADAAYRLVVDAALVQEAAPARDDAGRVVAELGHVDEQHLGRGRPESGAQRRQPGPADRHHDRFSGGHPVAEERNRAGEEVVLAPVEKCLVSV
jgi:hypothetical protein